MATAATFLRERTDWPGVMTVVTAGVVAAMQVGKGLIAGPMLQSDLGLDLSALGWITSVFAVVGVIGGMAAGAFVAAAGDRRLLAIGMALLALASFAGAASPAFALLLLSRIVEGFGFLLVVVAGPAILMRLVTTDRRDLVFALWSCFMPAGMAIAMLTGPVFADWQAIWWSNGLLTLASLALVFLAVSPSPATPGGDTTFRSDAAETLTSRGPMLLFVLFSLYSLMSFTLSSFLPILLIERLHVSLGTVGLLSAVITLVNVIGNLAAGHLLTRGFARGRLVASAALLTGVFGLWIFLSQSGGHLVLWLCILFSAIGGLIPATLISSVPILSPRPALAPMAMGLLMQGSNLGQLIGPVAVGTAIELYGWTSGAAFIGGSALLCIVLAPTLERALRTKMQRR
ncbi:MFS transporter [Ensifer adhaerens]|uniref:MFS transporter n=1 Tax=Ensifer adhaerens TaxID=106592 RepID=UPI001CBC0DFE|nr:MFS transporter [Ensifer adhaerens]MBZ7920824.1 MFS transporter [Ensifer adhaerens]UAX93278.1 MFS transporter [Ensifer adhaerens]UAY00915.1 MFS transporter [Ensifer adhaerens]UAY08296.1 MFS transporter [Ensifer adhaerens]